MPTERFLARPLREVLSTVTAAVTESQADLDRHSIAVQRELSRAIERGDLEYDLDASWFRFAEVDVDVKVALELSGEAERDSTGAVRGYKPTVTAFPYNPRLKSTYDFEMEAASDVSVRIVPVPADDRR